MILISAQKTLVVGCSGSLTTGAGSFDSCCRLLTVVDSCWRSLTVVVGICCHRNIDMHVHLRSLDRAFTAYTYPVGTYLCSNPVEISLDRCSKFIQKFSGEFFFREQR